MKKKMKKLMALVIVATMLLGTVAMVGVMLNSARADDSSAYDILYKPLDTEFYIVTYPDLAMTVGTDPYDLWRHYMEHGMAEGRIPYLGAVPGVFVAGYTEPNANATATTDNTATRDLSDWTPAQLAMLAQKQAEFDASSYVKVGWTEQQVQDLLFSLKSTYPENMSVGVCRIGAGEIEGALYGGVLDWLLLDEQGLLLCDKDGMRVMPVGYVESETIRRIKGGNIRDIRVGDELYTEGTGDGHVAVVIAHDDKGITVVESNRNGDEKFHWGRHISWNELENGGKTIYQQQNKWIEYIHYLY